MWLWPLCRAQEAAHRNYPAYLVAFGLLIHNQAAQNAVLPQRGTVAPQYLPDPLRNRGRHGIMYEYLCNDVRIYTCIMCHVCLHAHKK